MARESVAAKAGRLLLDGRVHVVEVGRRRVHALVDGTEGRYVVVYAAGGWLCSCPHPGRCSHRAAVELVTDPLGRCGGAPSGAAASGPRTVTR